MDFYYFDTAHAIRAHDFIIEISGGLRGVKDNGLIDSVLEHIQNDWYYPAFEDKICHLFYSINKNHAFNDGNKRTAIVLAAYFMEINSFEHKVSHFIRQMENVTVHVADNRIDKVLLRAIIVSILHENEYDETLKLQIIRAINVSEIEYDENQF